LLSTTYVVTSTINSFCPNNTDTVTVGVLPDLNFTKLPDTITCPQNGIILDLKPLPPPGVTYKAKWTPATFLNSDTLTAPTTTPNGPITYRVMLTSTANKCKGFDTVVVDVLTGFSLINNDTAICNSQTVQVAATGDSRYTFSWWHNSSAVNPFNDPNILTPVITPQPAITPVIPDTATYRLIAHYGQCRDSSQEFKIEVQPNPTVTVNNDASMCEGDTMKLLGVVSPSYYPYDLTWEPGASLNNNKVIDPIFSAKQTTTLKLFARSSAGCIDSDDVKLTVFPSKFVFAKGDTAICPGSTTQLHMTGNGVRSFRWSPDIHISDKKSNDPFVWPTASTLYTVYAVDTNSCSDTGRVKIIVFPRANIYLPDSVKIYPGEIYQMDPISNCTYFSWFPPVGLTRSDISNPAAKPEVNTRYVVNAKTESGCTSSDSITVLVSPESILNVPNAFTPGSEPNGTFKVLRRGDATLKTFSIYNRWGLRVFETSDINKGWDGTYNGQIQPMGVYVYSIEAVTPTGHKFTKQGNITLIR
jgi:gliding motility-associated-like protein